MNFWGSWKWTGNLTVIWLRVLKWSDWLPLIKDINIYLLYWLKRAFTVWCIRTWFWRFEIFKGANDSLPTVFLCCFRVTVKWKSLYYHLLTSIFSHDSYIQAIAYVIKIAITLLLYSNCYFQVCSLSETKCYVGTTHDAAVPGGIQAEGGQGLYSVSDNVIAETCRKRLHHGKGCSCCENVLYRDVFWYLCLFLLSIWHFCYIWQCIYGAHCEPGTYQKGEHWTMRNQWIGKWINGCFPDMSSICWL